MIVGFVGLGNMGESMARNVLEAGHALLVHTRTRERAGALVEQGARWMETSGDLVRASEIALACLPSIEASREVLLGPGGMIASARSGQVLVDHATVDLATSRACHEAAEAAGLLFLDAPVSGGPEGAAQGTLSIMAGGSVAAFDAAFDVLSAMGETVVRMGGPGAGTATKLANQLLVSTHTVSIAEALLLASRAGVDLPSLVKVLERSWGSSRMLSRNAPAMIAREFGASKAPVRNLMKDIGIIAELGRSLGLSLPTAYEAERIFKELGRAGQGERDIAAVLPYLEEHST